MVNELGLCRRVALSGPERSETLVSELGGDPRKGGSMTAFVKRLLADDAGQDLAEYGIALAVIGVIAAAAAIVIARDVGTLWSKAQSVIDNAATS